MTQSEPQKTSFEANGSLFLCFFLGAVFMALGAFLLLITPDEGSQVLGRSVLNLHKVALGQTAAIVGAIFLAAGLRPR